MDLSRFSDLPHDRKQLGVNLDDVLEIYLVEGVELRPRSALCSSRSRLDLVEDHWELAKVTAVGQSCDEVALLAQDLHLALQDEVHLLRHLARDVDHLVGQAAHRLQVRNHRSHNRWMAKLENRHPVEQVLGSEHLNVARETPGKLRKQLILFEHLPGVPPVFEVLEDSVSNLLWKLSVLRVLPPDVDLLLESSTGMIHGQNDGSNDTDEDHIERGPHNHRENSDEDLGVCERSSGFTVRPVTNAKHMRKGVEDSNSVFC
mmetsp:Transcript_13238/g.37103  ORF Transcript_13238/g.37103 Transcript_13238/m.37103 type:complete len:260 (+) Transcript_13238:1843-2622(+)